MSAAVIASRCGTALQGCTDCASSLALPGLPRRKRSSVTGEGMGQSVMTNHPWHQSVPEPGPARDERCPMMGDKFLFSKQFLPSAAFQGYMQALTVPKGCFAKRLAMTG